MLPQHSHCISLQRLTHLVALLALASAVCPAQNADVAKLPPVLDVHVHAMDASFPGLAPMCPNTSKFTASDPKGKEDPFGWVKEPCTPARYTSVRPQYPTQGPITGIM